MENGNVYGCALTSKYKHTGMELIIDTKNMTKIGCSRDAIFILDNKNTLYGFGCLIPGGTRYNDIEIIPQYNVFILIVVVLISVIYE